MFDSSVKRGAIAVALFLVIVLVSINFSHAFGVSTPYLENNTLKLTAGSNHTYVLTVQNGDPQDYYVDISYSSTDNIVNLRKETSYLLANTFNNSFFFDITIPDDAKAGNTYILEYRAKQRIINDTNSTSGLEIQRQITIQVKDNDSKSLAKEKILKIAWMSALALIIIGLISLIIHRVWRLAKSTSLRLDEGRITNYTISQAMNLKEVQILLEKITDEEYRLDEIRKLFVEKISELTTHKPIKNIDDASRRELIKIIEHTRLEKKQR